MSKRTFPTAIFTTFGLLQLGHRALKASFFCGVHTFCPLHVPKEEPPPSTDTTRKAVKQELLEVSLCNNNMSNLPAETGI